MSGNGLAVPGGDPAKLQSLADELEVLGTETANLGASTRQATESIRSAAEWTGDASDSFSAFASNLGRGADAAQEPLLQMAAAVRRYAGYLSTAQQKAEAFGSLAQAAQETSDGSLISAAEMAAQDATDALQALQEAGEQAAAQVTSAAGDLENLFGNQGPVQGWINSQPTLGEGFPFGRWMLGEPGDPVPPDLGMPAGDPVEPDLGLPAGDPIEPDLGLPVGDPIEPDLGLLARDPIPPGLLGPQIYYDSPSATEGGPEGQLGFGPDGEPVPADAASNLIRPPLDGDTRYTVYNPNDPDHPLTEIDSIENGMLVEQKRTTGQDPDMDIPDWVEKNVTTRLYKYEAAREFLPGFENAPIKLVFTEPEATPEFQSAVEDAVNYWKTVNPGVQVSVEWTP